MKRDLPRTVLALWTGLVIAFLFFPLAVVVLFSFNASSISRFPITGLTLSWYAKLASDPTIGQALVNSLIVAAATVVLSTSMGVLAAVGIHRYGGRYAGALRALSLTPMMVPRLIIGIALLTFYDFFKAPLSLWTVIAGHVVMTLPFVVMIVSARLVGFDKSLEEAAWDLGAGPVTVMREITLPFLKPAVVAAALMSFTLSFDEVVVTFFTTGNANTLPMVIWSMLRFGITPEVNAIATLTILASGAFAVVAELSVRKAGHPS